ncbi:integrase, catalytic region, zinc finger, CCHC-type containing protein [Tanacetum coccineum]
MYEAPHLPQPQISHSTSSVLTSHQYQYQMSHQTSLVPQNPFHSPLISTQPITEFPQLDSGLVVPLFNPGDDPIACLNKAMAFMSAVAILRFPSTNMLPKRPRNAPWFKEKAMLAEAQESGQILEEEQLPFLADLGITDCHDVQPIIIHNAAFQTDDLDAYNSDCDDISSANAVLMAIISNYSLDILSELIDSQMDDMIRDRLALKQQIDLLEQNISNQIKEKESLLQTFNVFKNESKEKEIEQARAKQPLDSALDFACKHVTRIQELLVYVRDTCPSVNKSSEKLIVVTPLNKNKKVRFAEPVTLQRVKSSTSASRSQPSGNTMNNRILRPTSSNMNNNVEDHPRSVKPKSNKMNRVVKPICNADVKHSMLNANSELICATCNKCMFDEIHDMCVLDFVKDVNVRSKSKYAKIFGNLQDHFYKVVHLKETTSKSVETQKPEIKVYSRRLKPIKSVGSTSKYKIVESRITNTTEPNQSWGSNVSDVPSSSSLVDFRLSRLFSGTVRFGNDQIAKIMSYGDYQLGNVMISWVAFRKHTCRIRDLEGVDLLRDQGAQTYTHYIGIFVGYAPAKKVFRINNKRTRMITKTIHVDFDELMVMASEQFSSGLGPQLMTPGTLSSGLVPNPPSSTPYVPPTKNDWDILFQPMFDELLNPPSSVVSPVPAIATQRPADPTGSPMSTLINQDTPSSSNPSTLEQEQSLIISQGVKESPKTPHFYDDPLHETLHEDSTSQGSSHVRSSYTLLDLLGKWTKNHPLANVIGDPSRLVSTRKHHKTNVMWCYFDAFLTLVEPKNFKEAILESSWIEAMQEEIHEFERIGIFINQSNYALEIIKKYGMLSSDPVDTPMVENSKLDKDIQGKPVDPTHYHRMSGSLMYPTSNRPDLVFAVCMYARYQAKPTEKHLHHMQMQTTPGVKILDEAHLEVHNS